MMTTITMNDDKIVH